MSIKKEIYGVIAASMTIINKDLSVNIEDTVKHSENLIYQGCHGCVIGGSTGMMQYIPSNEKRKLIQVSLANISFNNRFRCFIRFFLEYSGQLLKYMKRKHSIVLQSFLCNPYQLRL